MNYERNTPLISREDQLYLGEQTIAILGLGGLGGYLAQGALRLGIRHMILIDDDVFEKTNLNRQLFCTQDTLGEAKVDVVRRELLRIDPHAEIQVYKKRVQALEDAALFQSVALILDGLDSISSRYLLMAIAQKVGVPLIHGAIGGFEGQVAFLDGDKDRMKLIYPCEGEITPVNLAFLPSFIASLQLKLMLEYFLFNEQLCPNVLWRFCLREMEMFRISL